MRRGRNRRVHRLRKQARRPSPGAAVKAARPTFRLEHLEPRILLSATWIGTDADDFFEGAGPKNDLAYGMEGDDVLHGGPGHDLLDGGPGDDQLFGGQGNDILVSGGGHDLLDGGAGDDTFRFDGVQPGDEITVVGGVGGNDAIDLADYYDDQISNDGSTIVVDMGEEQSFTIHYSDVKNILTAGQRPVPVVEDAGDDSGEADAQDANDPVEEDSAADAGQNDTQPEPAAEAGTEPSDHQEPAPQDEEENSVEASDESDVNAGVEENAYDQEQPPDSEPAQPDSQAPVKEENQAPDPDEAEGAAPSGSSPDPSDDANDDAGAQDTEGTQQRRAASASERNNDPTEQAEDSAMPDPPPAASDDSYAADADDAAPQYPAAVEQSESDGTAVGADEETADAGSTDEPVTAGADEETADEADEQSTEATAEESAGAVAAESTQSAGEGDSAVASQQGSPPPDESNDSASSDESSQPVNETDPDDSDTPVETTGSSDDDTQGAVVSEAVTASQQDIPAGTANADADSQAKSAPATAPATPSPVAAAPATSAATSSQGQNSGVTGVDSGSTQPGNVEFPSREYEQPRSETEHEAGTPGDSNPATLTDGPEPGSDDAEPSSDPGDSDVRVPGAESLPPLAAVAESSTESGGHGSKPGRPPSGTDDDDLEVLDPMNDLVGAVEAMGLFEDNQQAVDAVRSATGEGDADALVPDGFMLEGDLSLGETDHSDEVLERPFAAPAAGLTASQVLIVEPVGDAAADLKDAAPGEPVPGLTAQAVGDDAPNAFPTSQTAESDGAQPRRTVAEPGPTGPQVSGSPLPDEGLDAHRASPSALAGAATATLGFFARLWGMVSGLGRRESHDETE